MKVLVFALLFFMAVAFSILGLARTGLLRGRRPHDLGVHAGRLKPPSHTPNSISSQAFFYPYHPQRDYAYIAPLNVLPAHARAMDTLATLVGQERGMRIVERHPDYLYAECQSPWLKFVDDWEFWFDPSGRAIHVRAARRLGRKDFRANRQRFERIRRRWQLHAQDDFPDTQPMQPTDAAV